VHARQRDEISKLSLNVQKEEKEISRLREMLRLTEKRELGIQTESTEAEEHHRGTAEKESSSWRKRMETSTGESELTSETGVGRVSQLSRRPTQSREREKERPNSANKKQTTVTVVDRSRFGETRTGKGVLRERAPLLKKYKFVPTLAFKHI
jgi:hypothetical protein